jgi:hypothetical protein
VRFILSLGLLLTLGAGAANAGLTPPPRRVERPAFLRNCEVVPDRELQEMRGCYASTYEFGLDITIDLTNPPPDQRFVQAAFTGIVPKDSKPPTINNSAVHLNPDGSFSENPVITGNSLQVTYNTLNQDPVAYQTVVGKTQQFSGISQVVQVKSNDNLVLANTNLTVIIPRAMLPTNLVASGSILSTGPRVGISF